MVRSILIFDNQYLTRKALQSIIENDDSLRMFPQKENSGDVNRIIELTKPDLVILDYLSGIDGLDELHALISTHKNTSFLVISNDQDHNRIIKVAESGVTGFLNKYCDFDEINTALQLCSQGKKFFCSKILEVLLSKKQKETVKSARLTDRECEVLKLVAEGHSTAQIADNLSVSIHTINTHRKNIIRKLDIQSPVQFVNHAQRLALI